ncbi:arginine deiminase-related protein [Thiotrichales bacterium 19S3-7]|nr:arginine deiminase-related protein [Thiotrichales bacterium 19S3-7]MCF6801922.1 arginine deiminase-related protein [Thiotrichales bacterium 19S3-11]
MDQIQKAQKAKSLIFMVEPTSFRCNEETLTTNAFQTQTTHLTNNLNQSALNEFKMLTQTLTAYGINVHVEKDLIERDTPDAIFPNNWVSFHENGKVLLYPMQAENRRRERSLNFIHQIAKSNDFKLNQVIDLSHEEANGRYLEGTGSIVFDHYNHKAYASLSERTDRALFHQVCKILNYTGISFHSHDNNQVPIYHTNVMMAIGDFFAVICTDSINDVTQKNKLLDSLSNDHKEIIDISLKQMQHFCANIIQLITTDHQPVIVMSKTAYNAFDTLQKEKLSRYGDIIYSDISTIETYGGGSVRCMICEVS